MHIPELDRCVLAAAGQGLVVWAEGHALHPVAVARERRVAVPALHVPQLDGLIGARGGDRAVVGRDRESPSHRRFVCPP